MVRRDTVWCGVDKLARQSSVTHDACMKVNSHKIDTEAHDSKHRSDELSNCTEVPLQRHAIKINPRKCHQSRPSRLSPVKPRLVNASSESLYGSQADASNTNVKTPTSILAARDDVSQERTAEVAVELKDASTERPSVFTMRCLNYLSVHESFKSEKHGINRSRNEAYPKNTIRQGKTESAQVLVCVFVGGGEEKGREGQGCGVGDWWVGVCVRVCGLGGRVRE